MPWINTNNNNNNHCSLNSGQTRPKLRCKKHCILSSSDSMLSSSTSLTLFFASFSLQLNWRHSTVGGRSSSRSLFGEKELTLTWSVGIQYLLCLFAVPRHSRSATKKGKNLARSTLILDKKRGKRTKRLSAVWQWVITAHSLVCTLQQHCPVDIYVQQLPIWKATERGWQKGKRRE